MTTVQTAAGLNPTSHDPSLTQPCSTCFQVFFFNDTATTEIYTLSLHDALPISFRPMRSVRPAARTASKRLSESDMPWTDRKSTRLNSSHQIISYAVFCLKKKKTSTFLLLHPIHKSYLIHHPPPHVILSTPRNTR